MNGLDGLLYMSATSESSGSAVVTLTFASGTDADIAQVQVQNKLQLPCRSCRSPCSSRAQRGQDGCPGSS
jgi:multidrug efflux pump subunit AcrB